MDYAPLRRSLVVLFAKDWIHKDPETLVRAQLVQTMMRALEGDAMAASA